MQGKLFRRCTHLLYCSVLSLGGNANTRRMSQPDMGSIFYIKNQWNILAIGNYYVNYQNFSNAMLLSSSDTKRTLMHPFFFTNFALRELVIIFTHYAINFPCIITLDVDIFFVFILLNTSLTVLTVYIHVPVQKGIPGQPNLYAGVRTHLWEQMLRGTDSVNYELQDGRRSKKIFYQNNF